jgi:NADH-quinone oxidoreductase subunit L/multicomponent Na+:H+ antiporter subunit D
MTALAPVAAVALPVAAVAAIYLTGSRPNVRELWTLLAAGGALVAVATMIPGLLAGETYAASAGTLVSDVALAFRVDALGGLFALLASLLWLVTSVYSVGYARGLGMERQTRYFAAFAASVAATLGVAFAANLLTLFVFYELLTVATYPLVTHAGTETARTAGRKYLAYTFGGGIAVLAGTLLVYGNAGTTEFASGGIAALSTADATMARAAFALLIAGFGVKAALMPVHGWLPDAMVAPTPVSGLLHAVAVVKSGLFGVARVVLDVFGPVRVDALGLDAPLAIAASVTIVAASVLALGQDELKRRLAYSTVSQLSYVVLGLALLHPIAMLGGLFHIAAHGFMKLTLFLCAGALHVETHTKRVSEMAGVGRRMPLTMGAFAVAAAGMAGVPLVAGFASKWYLLVGASAVEGWLFVGVLLLSGVLNVAYFWPVVYTAFFETPDEADPKPLVDGPLGGRPVSAAAPSTGDQPAVTDGGCAPAADSHTRAAGHAHDGDVGPVPVGREASWFVLGPILVAAAGAVALGLAPDAVFLRLAEAALPATDAFAEVTP